MQWPSKNVPQGGIFHPAKTNYSPETKQLLRTLLEESKMSIAQRQKYEYFLRNGQPFPAPKREKSVSKYREPLLIRPGSPRRRTRETIIKSGVYEREKFVPQMTVDREQEKLKLQNKMAYGNIKAPPNESQKLKKRQDTPIGLTNYNRFDELVSEIQERQDWLKEMEELGEADKYKSIIQQQIQARIHEMESLKISESPNMTSRTDAS